VSDLIKPSPPAGLTVEERLALLEAKLNPSPLALVPPITVGSLSNVPAPGSQLAAQWAQDASSMVVHRFASRASLDGWAAPVGACAVTVDDGTLYRRKAGAWSRVTPYVDAVSPTVSTVMPPGAWATVLSLTIPADPSPRLLDAVWHVRGLFFEPYDNQLALVVDGANAAQFHIPNLDGAQGGASHYWTANPHVIGYRIAANKPIVVVGQYYHTTGTNTPFNDLNNPSLNKLSVSVVGA